MTGRFPARCALVFGTLLFFGVAGGLVQSASGQSAFEKTVPRSKTDLSYSYAPIVKKVAPAVVNVYVRSRVRQQVSPLLNDPFFKRFFGEQFGTPSDRLQNSLGSGVIVTADGLVVTNNHVVQSEGQTDIKVALTDGREFEADVILKDERTDLAVLRIEGADKEFPYVAFADSDALEVGDIVLAIGNPFGVGQTVTSGIISALARTRVGISDYQFFIQTDAAINPGNSGGALVDMNGTLAGINTAIFTRSGGSQGIGFAIPANMVRVVVNSALRGGKVERPWLGADLQAVTPDLAEGLGLDRPQGAVVVKLADGGPAAKAGLRVGDVIVAVDGREVGDAQAALYRFATKGLGSESALDVVAKGRKRQVKIALAAAPETPARDARELDGANPFAGATVANLSPAVADELSLSDTSGVVVLETKSYSTARRLGLQSGDIIVQLNGTAVRSASQLRDLVAQRAKAWDMIIRRGGQEFRTVVRG